MAPSIPANFLDLNADFTTPRLVTLGKVPGGSTNMILGYNASTILPPGPPVPGLPFKKAAAFDSGGKTPQQLFSYHASEHTVVRCHAYAHRFVRRGNDREMLIYMDGSCLDQNDPHNVQSRRAGCAWVFKPEPYPHTERCEIVRLEQEGPSGQQYPQTSNRAELRAALGALQYRAWLGEGWQRMVVATDSEYLTLGITECLMLLRYGVCDNGMVSMQE